MSQIVSTIESAPGGDGPWMCTTRKDDVVTNATLTIATVGAAVNQARDDQAAALSGGEAFKKITIVSFTV